MKKSIISLLPALVLLFIFQCGYAQNSFTVNGKVIVLDNGQSIPQASVSIEGKGIGTATNASGLFSLMIPWLIFMTHSGYPVLVIKRNNCRYPG